MDLRPGFRILAALCLLSALGCDPTRPSDLGPGFRSVRCITGFGPFVVNVDTLGAPETSANFLAYLDSGFFDGRDQRDQTIIDRVDRGERVIFGRMLEGGRPKRADDPIANESDNGLSNERGTIAAYWTDDPDSAQAGLAVNLADNPHLDGGPDRDGYAVFGFIEPGMRTFDDIARAPLRDDGSPRNPIVLSDCHRM